MSHCTPSTPVGTSPLRYVAATRWPAACSRWAMPRPMPLLPPVTSTTRGVAVGPVSDVIVGSVSVTGPTYRLLFTDDHGRSIRPAGPIARDVG